MSPLTIDSIVKINDDVAHQRLADEIVMLDPASGRYYGLDRVGAEIWGLLVSKHTIAEIRDHVLKTYDVSVEDCTRDLFALLESLQQAGLIQAQS